MKRLIHFIHDLNLSALFTIIGIILLFSGAVIVTLIAPNFVDKTWTSPSSAYQVQMYEISDPNFYISSAGTSGITLQYVDHLIKDVSLLAFHESETLRIRAPKELEKYVTREKDSKLKLTSRILLLRHSKETREALKKGEKIEYELMELFDPKMDSAFSLSSTDGILQNWVDKGGFEVLEGIKSPYQKDQGVVYINNPIEFKVRRYKIEDRDFWEYDPEGTPIKNLQELTNAPLSFSSRKELIATGEHIYSIEGCWYCHTDQTRTLIQDLVLNGSDSYPAPPSSPNEYIYQKITFPGTKRNGPDLSRVGIKRPSRDWHKAHFWSPKSQSLGSIMPSYKHFFDFDPRGTSGLVPGVPNHRFEAIFQYLMTKGTRITAPTEAWWLGRDPLQIKEIIEGKKKLP